MREKHKNILVAVSGLTPQIVTETFYSLAVIQKIPIHQIIIITTAEGERRIKQSILNSRGPLVQLCQEYDINVFDVKIECELIKDSGNNVLEDIRTAVDNEFMAHKIMEIMYRLTQNEDTRIYASIAGGRKTMSAYLALAMQLFGREQDCLTHVLVWPPELESDRNFFYPPKTAEFIETSHGNRIPVKDIRIELAEIPIIRLRNVIKDEIAKNITDYCELISLSQFKIDELRQSVEAEWDESDHELRVRLGNKEYEPVKISGKLAAIYHGICERGSTELTEDLIEYMKQLYIERYQERTFDEANYGNVWDVKQIQKDISTIRQKIEQHLPTPLANFFKIQSETKREYTKYFILSPPNIVTS